MLLLMGGRSTLSLVNNLAALATNIVLNLALIPSMGLRGAALGLVGQPRADQPAPHPRGPPHHGAPPLRAHLAASGPGRPPARSRSPMLAVRAVLGPDQLGLAVGLTVAAIAVRDAVFSQREHFHLDAFLAGLRRRAAEGSAAGRPLRCYLPRPLPSERRNRKSLVGRHHRLRRRHPATLEARRRVRAGPHGPGAVLYSFTRPTVYVSRAQIALPDPQSGNAAGSRRSTRPPSSRS